MDPDRIPGRRAPAAGAAHVDPGPSAGRSPARNRPRLPAAPPPRDAPLPSPMTTAPSPRRPTTTRPSSSTPTPPSSKNAIGNTRHAFRGSRASLGGAWRGPPPRIATMDGADPGTGTPQTTDPRAEALRNSLNEALLEVENGEYSAHASTVGPRTAMTRMSTCPNQLHRVSRACSVSRGLRTQRTCRRWTRSCWPTMPPSLCAARFSPCSKAADRADCPSSPCPN